MYELVKSLVLPPGLLILLMLAAFFAVRGVLGRTLLFIAWVVLATMSTPIIAALLASGLEHYPPLNSAALARSPAQAIVVLSSDRYRRAPEYGGDTVGPHTLERIRYGAKLHRETGLPIYLTGGGGESSESLARLMDTALREDYGIAAAQLEEDSLTTWENAEFTVPLLQRAGIEHALLVTHAWHMPRAIDAFARLGYEMTPAPTSFMHTRPATELLLSDWLPSASAFTRSYLAIHEWIGRAWYEIRSHLEPWLDGYRFVPSEV